MPKVEKTPAGSYRIRYTDPWGKRAVITRRTAADVRAAYKNAVSDMARGEYVDPRAGRVTLADWADQWLAGARNVTAGGRDLYKQALARITPELGKVPLGKLSPDDIDRYIAKRTETHAASTVHRDYRTLHRMLTVAVERRIIATNPARHVQPPKVPRRSVPVLTVDQVDQLADALTAVPKGKRKRKDGGPLDSRYRAWVYVAAYGGLRWSETVGLRRGNVDGPVIHVAEQLVLRRDGTWDRCQPKVGSVRTVTLPAFAADELAAHLDTYSQPGPDGLVFPTRNGTPIQGPSWTANVFKKALRRAGLPDVRVHDLRHTSVSLALAAGGRLEVVQERHGHSSIKVTADTYGHRYTGADEAVAAQLDDLRATAMRARLRAV